jgi:glycosyltransferase involved in cell wall biosynthesis
VKLDRLLHYVSLDGAGGVEQQFVEFAQAARQQGVAAHGVVACGRRVHPLIRSRLEATGADVAFEKYAGRLKLPKWPATLRAARQRRLVVRHQPDAVIIWNRLRDSLGTLAAAGAERTVYWERGASWFAGDTPGKRAFLEAVPAIICNSQAARRMLELRWDYRGQIRVIHNALRPSLLPATPVEARALPEDGQATLGMVARLESIKGVALAIHALARLREQGRRITLRIAGDGPERQRLETEAQRLGIARHVVFEGLVADMGAFYERIDLLVHPALREPFGQIVVEAGAYGIPAVVAAVDGLVEVVRHETTGLHVLPTLELAEYRRLGGGEDDLPPYIYDPAQDRIATPRAVDPARLAEAIAACLDDGARYQQMSAQAIAAVSQRFVFDDHVHEALASINAFVHLGCLDPGERP